MHKQDFYSADQAAKYIKCSRQWFYKLKDQQGVSPIKVGYFKVYSHADIDRLKKLFSGGKK
jgi:hypothetical protein